MNSYTEHTWTLVTFNEAIKDLMKTYVKFPPRQAQSETYSGPITLSQYENRKRRETSRYRPVTNVL